MQLIYKRQDDDIADQPTAILAPDGPLTESAPLAIDTSPPTIISASQSTASISSSPSPTSSSSPESAPTSNGVPLSTLIPAIVVPIVVVALVAPIILYYCLTRHDRQRATSRPSSSRIQSGKYPDLSGLPDSRAEVTSAVFFGDQSSDSQHLKGSEIMNFDLGPTIEKPLPVVDVTGSPEDSYSRPTRPERPDEQRRPESSIGQAVSRYSGTHDSLTIPAHLMHNRTSVQELSEENMRIGRLATDSRTSLRRYDLDRVSDISAPEDRTSRQVGGRGLDEVSEVSSLGDESDTLAITDHGGNVLSSSSRRRSGQTR